LTLGVVIQARMGSSRLPGKVLKPIAGRPLLGHVLGRLGQLRSPAQVIVATSTVSGDDAIADFCTSHGIACFRGSELDVLARYAECARLWQLCHIVRLTADNPFTDVEELDRLIELHLSGKTDYSNSLGQLPIGVGAEIFSRPALERSAREGHAPHHREHVDEYILENPDEFSCAALEVSKHKCSPSLRLTVDTQEDYDRACRLAERARDKWLTTEEAIELCSHSA
jgi:spore coat polysaccharide biosynthesis protein SpsF